MDELMRRFGYLVDELGSHGWNTDVFDDVRDEIENLRKFRQSLHPTELSDYMKTYYVINSTQISEATDYAIKVEGVCEKCPGVINEVFRLLGLDDDTQYTP